MEAVAAIGPTSGDAHRVALWVLAASVCRIHSTQSTPATIEEVRRIMHLHGEALAEAGLHCAGAVPAPTE